MNYLFVVLILLGSLSVALWLRGQQRRVEFDAHVDEALDLVEDDLNWSLWEQELAS